MKILLIWFSTLVAFVGVDAVWLWLAGPRLYRDVLGEHMRPAFDFVPAVAFYFIYTVALTILVLQPALERGAFFRALALGALFGLAAYATYDLSNQATLKFWQWRLTLVDMAWGTFATAVASVIGFQVGAMLTRAQ